MPIVFVHGVSTRPGPDYDRGVSNRDAFFRSALTTRVFQNPKFRIFNPLWGDAVIATPNPNPIVALPSGQNNFQAFAGSQTDSQDGTVLPDALLIPKTDGRKGFLVDLANRSFSDALDAVFSAAMEQAVGTKQKDAVSGVALLAAEYADAKPAPDWVGGLSGDQEFIDELIKNLEDWRQKPDRGQQPSPVTPAPAAPAGAAQYQAFGFEDILNAVKAGADGLAQRVKDVPINAFLDNVRPAINQRLTLFLGDVFSYLANRGNREKPGEIPGRILASLNEAAAARSDNDPLLVIGHSMGAVILYDLLTYFQPSLKIDALVTVGSQASFFRQLGLYENVPAGPPKGKRPAGVPFWLNVFDTQDILSFLYAPEFEGVEDFLFKTEAGLFGAHVGYFLRPTFYQRLAARLTDQFSKK